jgi:hypothetical protein
MVTHPHHHYHALLNMRSLRKEASESWALVASVRSILEELALDPSEVVLFDLCSGKALTAVLLALEFPTAKVVALDIISDRHLPHTLDCTNLRYENADLFKSAGVLAAEMGLDAAAAAAAPSRAHSSGSSSGSSGGGGGGGSKQPQRHGVLVGSHLCGRLSAEAVKLFSTLDGTSSEFELS